MEMHNSTKRIVIEQYDYSRQPIVAYFVITPYMAATTITQPHACQYQIEATAKYNQYTLRPMYRP